MSIRFSKEDQRILAGPAGDTRPMPECALCGREFDQAASRIVYCAECICECGAPKDGTCAGYCQAHPTEHLTAGDICEKCEFEANDPWHIIMRGLVRGEGALIEDVHRQRRDENPVLLEFAELRLAEVRKALEIIVKVRVDAGGAK